MVERLCLLASVPRHLRNLGHLHTVVVARTTGVPSVFPSRGSALRPYDR